MRCRTECSQALQSIDPSTNKRIDNVFECFDGALPLCGDVALTDARRLNAELYVSGKEREYEPGAAAVLMTNYKNDKYKELLPASDSDKICVFRPLVMEAHGRWAPEARKIFKQLIDRAVTRHGVSKAGLSSYWRARLCFAMHKTAAAGLRQRASAQDSRAEEVEESCKEINFDDWQICRA
jgi:hypothetical protein